MDHASVAAAAAPMMGRWSCERDLRFAPSPVGRGNHSGREWESLREPHCGPAALPSGNIGRCDETISVPVAEIFGKCCHSSDQVVGENV